jgi:hypothetical protein
MEIDLLDILRVAGRYLTYQEFIKENPDLENLIGKNDFYKNLGGDTKEKNKRELKRSYLEQPTKDYEEDLKERVDTAKRIVRGLPSK